MYRIFDAHCHIYPEAIAPKAVEGIEQFYEQLPFDHYDGTVGTLLSTGREAGISHFLVHSVATTPHQVSGINRFISSEVAGANGAFTGLGTLHPDSERPEQDFSELAALGLKGVKLHPDFQRFEADSAKAMRIYGLCVEAELPVLVHTASLLSGFDNITVDSSSSFYATGREKGLELVRKWGADRIMFGTDYPMWKPQPEIDCLLAMGLKEDEYRRIFWDNAVRVFGLGGDGA